MPTHNQGLYPYIFPSDHFSTEDEEELFKIMQYLNDLENELAVAVGPYERATLNPMAIEGIAGKKLSIDAKIIGNPPNFKKMEDAITEVLKAVEFLKSHPKILQENEYTINLLIKILEVLKFWSQPIESDLQQQKLKVMQLVLELQSMLPKHESVQALMKDDTSEVMVLSVACANNIMERVPNFACQMANRGAEVSVYNMDRSVFDDIVRTETYQQIGDFKMAMGEIANRCAHLESLKLKLLGLKTFFPDYPFKNLYSAYTETLDLEILNRQKLLLANYSKLFRAKKRTNPDFKLVLISCYGPKVSESILTLANMLVAKGFKLGVDLEFVSAYGKEKPAIVYRDLTELNANRERFIEIFNTHEHTIDKPYHDHQHHFFVFPHLDDLTHLFGNLSPESLKPRGSRLS